VVSTLLKVVSIYVSVCILVYDLPLGEDSNSENIRNVGNRDHITQKQILSFCKFPIDIGRKKGLPSEAFVQKCRPFQLKVT
jgi:hypothetical protein